MKKYKELYPKNKNIIKQKKTNNLVNNNKKQNLKKNTEVNINRNKNNKITKFESQIHNNENTNKINFINARKHIFLSPMINKKNQEKNKLSSKKVNKENQINNNNLYQYNAINGMSNKEIKKIFFKFDSNKNKSKQKIVNKYQYQDNLLESSNENINKLNIINKENSSTIKSEDKTTEKDFNLEKNEITQNRATANSKQLKDYFKIARKVLKNASHSLVESIKNTNNFLEKDNSKNKINELGKITNRNIEKEEDSFNYTIKKVPIFAEVNMFPQNAEPQKKSEYNNNSILYKLLIKNNDNGDNNKIKICIINYLDLKSVIILSSINKDFFKYIRSAFYNFIFNKIYKNKNIKLIKKVNNSLIKSVYLQYKSDIYEKISTESLYIDIILNDIARTFPKDSKFQKEGKYYKKLYNVLTKYSNYNKNIGYAQGLNFMFANALLLYENEKEAFFYIDGLIKKFNLNKFFAEKNSKLIEEIQKYSKILEKYIPEIVNYFDKKNIYHEFFSTGWILTLFSNVMDTKNLFICWNFMIIYGWKFFYSLVIQILRFYKNTIFHTNENDLNHLMKNLLKVQKFSEDLPNILKNTFFFMQKHIIL